MMAPLAPRYPEIPTLERLRLRAAVLRSLRATLDGRGYVEVETPIRIPTPALEAHIDALPSGSAWLRTSPELHMKRLVAAGAGSIYQIGSCFRANERGDRHHPEFTMLEWYRSPAGCQEMLEDCRALVLDMAQALDMGATLVYGGCRIPLDAPWEQIPVREAFRRWAGWDPVRHWQPERFDADMALVVEPALPTDRPVILIDYPAPAAALARLSPANPRVAERWELYLAGIEICNAFSELTDPVEQRRRFEEAAAFRQQDGRTAYALDEPFLRALENGLPPCGGASLGVDRLVMLAADVTRIDDIRPFCEPSQNSLA